MSNLEEMDFVELDKHSTGKFIFELDENDLPKKDGMDNFIYKEEWKARIEKMYFKKDGVPVVFYHGTGSKKPEEPWVKFESRFMTDSGFHFGTLRASQDIFQTNSDMLYNRRVFSALIFMENPLRISDLGSFNFPNPLDLAVLGKKYSSELPNKLVEELEKKLNTKTISENINIWAEEYLKENPDYRKLGHFNSISSHFLLFVLKKFNYDGLVYENETESKGDDSVIVLDKSQLIDAETGKNLWVL